MSKGRKNRRQHRLQSNRELRVAAILGIVLLALAIVVVIRGTIASPQNPTQNRVHIDPELGNPNAPVTIIEYGAYSCPSCRAWHQAGVINQILAKYPDKVKFIFRDFPVITPQYDRMAAALAHCVLDQGQDRFWAFHNTLYERADSGSSQDDLIRLAGQVGADTGQLTTCAQAQTYQSFVQSEEEDARRLGLPGTPSFLVNDQPIFNASPEILDGAVKNALR